LNVPWYFYAGFVVFVIAMLLVDLLFFHKEEEEPSVRKSATWVAVWVSLAIAFGIGVWAIEGGARAGEFFAGYLIEYSLSVDNMFVFVVIFSYFSIPMKYQHNVLFYGILGAIIFRGLFIAIGTTLVENFHWVIYIFGAFLLYTAYRVAIGATEEIHPEHNPVLKFARKRFPTTTSFEGQKLFTIENGKRMATPLFITLIFIETTDIIFAIDSIPAIFAITREPFIVLTSNVFAILGLRALYFLLAGGLNRLHLLNYGLAIVLGFVGIKMLLEGVPCSEPSTFCEVEAHAADGHVAIPIWLSLTFIITVLAATTVISLVTSPTKPDHTRDARRPEEPLPSEGERLPEEPLPSDDEQQSEDSARR
jgi:tellurite resistance protein TerC